MAKILKLNDECIAGILSQTSSIDMCNISLVSKGFKDPSEWDQVWEKFLPSDYKSVVPTSLLNKFDSKKQLFAFLCKHPIILEGGNKCWFLDRDSGKRCLGIGAREMAIHSDKCIWVPHPHSRFAEVAKIFDVHSLRIRCIVDTTMLCTQANYTAYLVMKITPHHLHGRRYPAALSTLKFVEEDDIRSLRVVYLDFINVEGRSGFVDPIRRRVDPESSSMASSRFRIPNERADGWEEVEIGSFYYKDRNDGNVEIYMRETTGDHTESGVILNCIEVRPKVV